MEYIKLQNALVATWQWSLVPSLSSSSLLFLFLSRLTCCTCVCMCCTCEDVCACAGLLLVLSSSPLSLAPVLSVSCLCLFLHLVPILSISLSLSHSVHFSLVFARLSAHLLFSVACFLHNVCSSFSSLFLPLSSFVLLPFFISHTQFPCPFLLPIPASLCSFFSFHVPWSLLRCTVEHTDES